MASERLYLLTQTIPAGASYTTVALDLTRHKPVSVIFPATWTNCDVLLWSAPELSAPSFLASPNTGLRYRLISTSAYEQFLLPAAWFVTTRYLIFVCVGLGTETLAVQPAEAILTVVCKLREDVSDGQPT